MGRFEQVLSLKFIVRSQPSELMQPRFIFLRLATGIHMLLCMPIVPHRTAKKT